MNSEEHEAEERESKVVKMMWWLRGYRGRADECCGGLHAHGHAGSRFAQCFAADAVAV